jgi:hypothetical protein
VQELLVEPIVEVVAEPTPEPVVEEPQEEPTEPEEEFVEEEDTPKKPNAIVRGMKSFGNWLGKLVNDD